MDFVASFIYQHDKRSGITYVYESESYWDKEKKQSRCKRRLIGKIDKETGEIVPTRNRSAENALLTKAKLTAKDNAVKLKYHPSKENPAPNLSELVYKLIQYNEMLRNEMLDKYS